MKEEFFDNDELQRLYSEGDPESARSIPAQKKVVFKEYNTSFSYIFPASTNDYIPRKHIARFASTVIDKAEIGFLPDKSKGGGAKCIFLRNHLISSGNDAQSMDIGLYLSDIQLP